MVADEIADDKHKWRKDFEKNNWETMHTILPQIFQDLYNCGLMMPFTQKRIKEVPTGYQLRRCRTECHGGSKCNAFDYRGKAKVYPETAKGYIEVVKVLLKLLSLISLLCRRL